MPGAAPDLRLVAAALDQVEAGLREGSRRPLVLGLCGAQGSGKSTLAAAILACCGTLGIRAAVLSLDDLYLTRAERRRLAADVHPLLATRGPPGTHDIALGLATIASLERGDPAALPRFDKADDDRRARAGWGRAPADCEVLVFEGWCVGARPQAEPELAMPVNALERDEDRGGTWRGFVNAALAGPYAQLFARIDRLMLLAAPRFETVFAWRRQQEQALRAKAAPEDAGLMNDAALQRFIAHYERLTRFILDEMPARADCVAWLNSRRKPVRIAAGACSD